MGIWFHCPRIVWPPVMGALLLWLSGGIMADGAVTMLPGAPSGVIAAGPPSGYARDAGGGQGGFGLGSEIGDAILEGLKFDTSFATTYNSNVAPTQDLELQGESKDDVIAGFGGNVRYQSKASSLTFGGQYYGRYNEYLGHEQYSGYDQGGDLVVNYDGGRFTLSGRAGLAVQRGSNVNYGSDFVTQTTLNTSLSGRYVVSPKTSLAGTLGQHSTLASESGYNDTESYDATLSALWKYSALTELGPGLRYTYRSGSTQTGRTSIGPTINLNYKLGAKLRLNTRIGIDFASYEDGEAADPMFSTSLGLAYQASKLWGMNLTVYRDAQADASVAGGFTEVTAIRVGYNRKVRRAIWGLGAGYQLNSSESSGDADQSSRPDYDSIIIDTSLGMPIFYQSCYGQLFMQYNAQSGQSTGDWDSVQVGFSLSRSF